MQTWPKNPDLNTLGNETRVNKKNAWKKTKTGSVIKSRTHEDMKIKQETTKLKPKIMTVHRHNKGLKMSWLHVKNICIVVSSLWFKDENDGMPSWTRVSVLPELSCHHQPASQLIYTCYLKPIWQVLWECWYDTNEMYIFECVCGLNNMKASNSVGKSLFSFTSNDFAHGNRSLCSLIKTSFSWLILAT